MEVNGQLHALDTLPHSKSSCTHGIGGWVSLRASLHTVGKKKIPSLSLLGNEP